MENQIAHNNRMRQMDAENSNPGQSAVALLDSATLAIASNMARRGDYKQAEEILVKSLGTSSIKAETLNLLAKINVQQGKFKEAQELWKQALQNDPGNTSYIDALAECNYRLNNAPGRSLTNTRRVLLILNVISIVAIVIIVTLAVSLK